MLVNTHSGRYIVIEGPIGAGKVRVAEKVARALNSRLVLETLEENPFFRESQKNPEQSAFQTQLYFLLSRYKTLQELAQLTLFHRGTVGDILFDRDRLFAKLLLNEAEFTLYDQMFQILRDRVTRPDLVVYLSASSDVLWRRLKEHKGGPGNLTKGFLRELIESYNQFFFNYDQSPLLVVNADHLEFIENEEAFRHFLLEVVDHQKGVKYYVPSDTDPEMLDKVG